MKGNLQILYTEKVSPPLQITTAQTQIAIKLLASPVPHTLGETESGKKKESNWLNRQLLLPVRIEE
jgi:hypothetical protein